MKNDFDQFLNYLSDYSYGSAYDLVVDNGHEESDIAKVLLCFRYSINFDFDFAKEVLQETSVKFKHDELYLEIRTSLENLIEGKPDAIFSELMFSMVTQIAKDEYIDFMGRIYRYREALLKYLFLQKEGKKNINMLSEEMSKRYQIARLQEKYNIHTHNLGLGLGKYFKNHCSDDYGVSRVMEILDSKKMLKLMNLRNDSIIGHGFVGISRRDIEACYGSFDELMADYKKCVGFVGLELEYEKYVKWNNSIIIKAKEEAGFLV